MRRLNTLFGATSELKTLTVRAGEILALQKIWGVTAPPPLNQHSHVGLLHNGQLTVYTSSNAVAAKLKMQLPGLIKKLQTQGVEVTSIRVEVQVATLPRVPSRAAHHISHNAALSLLKLADSMPDSPLQKALKRLARRT